MNAPKFLPSGTLSKQIGVHVSSFLPDQSRQSLPIPQFKQSQPILACFFCPSSISPEKGASLAPPDFVVQIDPSNGEILQASNVTPAYFGNKDKAATEIGVFTLPPGVDVMAFLALKTEFFDCCDQLLPWFWTKRKAPSSSAKTAKRLLEIFNIISEPPLKTYYQSSGSDFFDWLESSI